MPNDMHAYAMDATTSAGEAVPGRQGRRLYPKSDSSLRHDSMLPEGMNPAITAIQLPNRATSSRPLCSFFESNHLPVRCGTVILLHVNVQLELTKRPVQGFNFHFPAHPSDRNISAH